MSPTPHELIGRIIHPQAPRSTWPAPLAVRPVPPPPAPLRELIGRIIAPAWVVRNAPDDLQAISTTVVEAERSPSAVPPPAV